MVSTLNIDACGATLNRCDDRITNGGDRMKLVARAPSRSAADHDTLLFQYELRAGDRFDRHAHEYHQLSWARTGLLTARTDDRTWSLPATVGLWIPAGVMHDVEATRPSDLHNLYVRVPTCPITWSAPTIVSMTQLLEALVIRLVDARLPNDARRRAESVLYDSLEAVDDAGYALRLPSDPRAREVAEALVAHPADARTLDEWSAAAHTSRSTLARHFRADTGMSFVEWRTHVRVRAAIGHLAAGHSVGWTARQVGYQDPSWFIAGFRRTMGRTPAEVRRPTA
jgi:AraC-like DNA-binding protein